MTDKSNKARYILAISQFSLAAALIYFAFVLSRVTTQIPDILSSVETTSEKINPVVTEIGKIRAQIPAVLKEIEEVRKQVPAILAEVKAIREQMPAVLVEVKEIREQVPLVLAEASLYRNQIPLVLNETKKVRLVIPKVLAEIKLTREAIPPMLLQGERMISDARSAGKQASEGAVTGVITGIFKAPFKLIGSLGKSVFGSSSGKIKGLTKEDEDLATETAIETLATGKLGESRNWNNSKSGNDGTVTVKEVKLIDGKECRVMNSVVRVVGEEKINTHVTACLNDKSEWEIHDE